MKGAELAFGKSIRDVTLHDLLALEGGHESTTLEVKVSDAGWFRPSAISDDAKRRGRLELAKDVSAMANAVGGVIVIGIGESDGIIGQVVGIEKSRYDALSRDISETLRRNTDPMFSGVDFHPVEVDQAKVAMILEVERSGLGPIFCKVPGEDELVCYKRIGAKVQALDQPSIGQEFARRETVRLVFLGEQHGILVIKNQDRSAILFTAGTADERRGPLNIEPLRVMKIDPFDRSEVRGIFTSDGIRFASARSDGKSVELTLYEKWYLQVHDTFHGSFEYEGRDRSHPEAFLPLLWFVAMKCIQLFGPRESYLVRASWIRPSPMNFVGSFHENRLPAPTNKSERQDFDVVQFDGDFVDGFPQLKVAQFEPITRSLAHMAGLTVKEFDKFVENTYSKIVAEEHSASPLFRGYPTPWRE